MARDGRHGSELRSLLLAVQVLEDVELTPSLLGVRLRTGADLRLADVRGAATALGVRDAADPAHRAVLAGWLRTCEALTAMPLGGLVDLLRPVALPPGHPLHPGPGWVLDAVLGGALDLGVGVLGLDPADPDRVVLVPPAVWPAIRFDPAAAWPRCRRILEEMGALAARRWESATDGQLRPMGDCDVLTLLGSASLRVALASTDGGMPAVIVPMRRRGWTRLSRLDPAFAPAAATATDPAERGVLRPLLVTADEVVLAAEGSRLDISLTDPVAERWSPTLAVQDR